MKTKSLKFFPLIFAAVLACWPTQTRATIALDFTPSGSVGNGSDNVWGWDFSLSTNVFVTDLGIWDGSSGTGVGDGLVEAHTVSIWTSGGTLVTSAIVPAGAGGTLVDDFRYISITPTQLLAGNYVIGAHYLGRADIIAFNATGITTASEVTFGHSRQNGFGQGNGFPTGVSDAGGFFGPNFQFTTSTSVPDTGTTCSLFGLSLMGLAFLRRLRYPNLGH